MPSPSLFPIPTDEEYIRLQRIEHDMFGPRCLLQSSWVGVSEHGLKHGAEPLHYENRLLPCARPKKADTAYGKRRRSDYIVKSTPGGFVWTPKP